MANVQDRGGRWARLGLALAVSSLMVGAATLAVAGPSVASADETVGPATAGQPDQAACVAQISTLFAQGEARDDVQLLHNQVYEDVDVSPGQGLQYVAHASGSQARCVGLLPPGLVVPPHPQRTP